MRARFINEEQKQGSLFRSTNENWLWQLLDGGIEMPEMVWPPKFISFSRDSESGGMDKFGHVKIEFDEDEVFKQGAQEIVYETDFFDTHSDISNYVTAYSDKWDFYDQQGYFDDEENENKVDREHWYDWKAEIEGYEHEQEIIATKLKLVPGLIKKISFDPDVYNNQDPHEGLMELIKKYNIPYEGTKS